MRPITTSNGCSPIGSSISSQESSSIESSGTMGRANHKAEINRQKPAPGRGVIPVQVGKRLEASARARR